MRLPESAHTAQPWRIHEIAYDFRVEDVWALPTPGGPDDFPRLVELIRSFDPQHDAPFLVRSLFTVRTKLGDLLRWDDPKSGLGARVDSLRERLPADLVDHVPEPKRDGSPFAPLYITHDEFAAEIANQTVHGVIHIGWVSEAPGSYRGQLAILVKPNGLLGTTYVAAIKPFRHFIVYPQTIRGIERGWKTARVG